MSEDLGSTLKIFLHEARCFSVQYHHTLACEMEADYLERKRDAISSHPAMQLQM